MAEEQEHPRDRFGTPGPRPEPDETGEFDPFADEAPGGQPFADQPGPDDRPRSGGAADSWISDRTEQMPTVAGHAGPPPGNPDANDAADRTQRMPAADDATRVTPRAGGTDSTSVLPPVDRPDAGRSEAAARAAAGRGEPDWPGREPAWAARAQVRPGAGGDYTPTDWVPTEREPRKHWWMPIVVGLVVFVLLGVLGFGVWLILQGIADNEEPAPSVTTPSAAPATTEPSTAPSSAAPTTASPQQSSAPAAPEEVPIPALVGLSSADARQALDRVGLPYRLIFRPSAGAPAGTVIDSDPPEGRRVPADTEVTLVIASASAPSTSAGATTPGNDAGLPQED